MGAPRLSFIIPTIDRREYLLGCLRSIAAQEYPSIEVVIVDDNSTDGTQDAVMSEFPGAIYIRNPRRVGVGPALTQGAERASGDILVNLDDDGYLGDTDAAERIVSYFDTMPGVGAVTFRVEAPDGTVRHREIPFRHKRMPDTDTEVGLFLGGAVAFRRSALTDVGGYPDVEYYAWEQDVTVRLIKGGWTMLFTPGIRFVHLAIPSPQNTGDRESGYVSIRTKLAARYLPAPYAQVHVAIWIAYSLVEAAKKGHLRDTAHAIRESLTEWPKNRADGSRRLTRAETRKLSALSGRTWY